MLNKGDNVLVTVSEFDRGRGDPSNLIGVPPIQEKEGKYKIGTKHGIVQNWLERNCLWHLPNILSSLLMTCRYKQRNIGS